MKSNLLMSLMLLSASPMGRAWAVSYRDLTRSDLGVSYLVPQSVKKQDLISIKTQLAQKKNQKTYYKDQKKPEFKPLPNPLAAKPTVIGRMSLHSPDPKGDYSTPMTGVPLTCTDVRARKAEADQLLQTLDASIEQLETLLASVDISTAPPDVLAALTQSVVTIGQFIEQIWTQLQERYPITFSQEKYHLQYVWTYPFNQVCKGVTQRTTDPQFTDLSMPGLIWSAQSGQQLGDFLGIVQVPQYELSRVSFVKEVSLASACLDDQSLEIQGQVQAKASTDCPFGANNGFLLKAGAPNPMDTPGAFSEKRLESVSCKNLFADLKAWSSRPSMFYAYPIGYQLSSLKLRNRGSQVTPATYGGYMSGLLNWTGDQWSYRGPAVFSDRKDPNQPDQLFAISKPDDHSVTIDTEGHVSITLHTWGNRTFPLEDLQCMHDPFASYVSGWLIEDHGPALWTLSLHPLQVKKNVIKDDGPILEKPWKGEIQ